MTRKAAISAADVRRMARRQAKRNLRGARFQRAQTQRAVANTANLRGENEMHSNAGRCLEKSEGNRQTRGFTALQCSTGRRR